MKTPERRAPVCGTAVVLGLIVGITSFPDPAEGHFPAPVMHVDATLSQLMRGALYPASNVILAAQNEDPANIKKAKGPSIALNLFESEYAQWGAVENSALALAEVSNLLMLPGRKCSNGVDVPIKNPNWPKFVQGLRDSALAAYKAAQSKNRDDIVRASHTMTMACASCHDKWREKRNLADRCKQ